MHSIRKNPMENKDNQKFLALNSLVPEQKDTEMAILAVRYK